MVLRHHWGLLKNDKLQQETERVTPVVADKDSYGYGQKDFDVALKAEISDDEEGSTLSRSLASRATQKRTFARATKREAQC